MIMWFKICKLSLAFLKKISSDIYTEEKYDTG